MKWLIILLCVVAIGAAATDTHCRALRPAPDTVIVACRAGRLP
jgi:hypothetical protein